MWSPLPLLCLVGLASVYADYSAPAADQAAPAAVVQVPYSGPLDYNQPGYTNVRGGNHHGAFLDGFVDNFDHHRHGRRRHRRHHRHHGHHLGGYFPGYPGSYAPGFPGYGYGDEALSNPFFVPDRRHRRRHHGRKHRKDRRRRDSRDWSDSRGSRDWSDDRSD